MNKNTEDIVERLRHDAFVCHVGRLPRESKLLHEAADEIERLRKELGQVDDADSWVSQTDAAHLDSLLNWCEFNAMEWHRALQRLVNDRARLRGEVNRIRELSGKAGQLREERDEARREVCGLLVACHTDPDDDKPDPNLKHIHAGIRGWDCFKEDKEDTDD